LFSNAITALIANAIAIIDTVDETKIIGCTTNTFI
jgi:hypothetical protein